MARKKKPTKEFSLKENIPEGPYKTELEILNALLAKEELDAYRFREERAPVLWSEFEKHTGITLKQAVRETSRVKYGELRESRTKSKVSQFICTQWPLIERQLHNKLKDPDTKTQGQAVDKILGLIEQFNISSADVSRADLTSEFDVDEAIEQVLAIASETFECPKCFHKGYFNYQKFMKGFLDLPPTVTAVESESSQVGDASPPSGGSPGVGANASMASISAPETASLQ